MPDEIQSMTFNQTPALYYNAPEAISTGLFLEWDRYSSTGVSSYNIYRSDYFDGNYELVANIEWPHNEVVDTGGGPTNYYKVEEIANDLSVMSISAPFNGEELLIKSSLRYELEHLLNIPIYDEEVLFTKNRTEASTAFPFWNYNPRPQIRITGKSNEGDNDPLIILSEYDAINKTINPSYDPIQYTRDGEIVEYTGGNNYSNGLKIKLDYNGKIFFVNNNGDPEPIKSYDTVFCTYYVKAFTTQHMNSSLNLALQKINAQPGSTKYQYVYQTPYYYDAALVYGAAYYLLRNLLVQLTQRQRRLLFEDPDARIYDDIAKAAEMYKEDFKEQVEKLAIVKYPGIRGIVVPEFNMPGGRSRFFRYIWNIGTGN